MEPLTSAPGSRSFGLKGCSLNVLASPPGDGSLLEEITSPEPSELKLLRDAADTLSLSARGYHRTLCVPRTLADLDGEEKVARIHIAEALSYRGETLRRAAVAARGSQLQPF